MRHAVAEEAHSSEMCSPKALLRSQTAVMIGSSVKGIWTRKRNSMDKICVVCGSNKIIPGVSVEDSRTTAFDAAEHVVRIGANPKAPLFNRITESKLKAYICGACGYTAFFAEDPQALYEAYQSYLRHI
jgi:hypothetical protein